MYDVVLGHIHSHPGLHVGRRLDALLQHEDAGQRDDSRVRQDSVGLLSLHPDTQNGTYFRTYVSFAYRSREAKTNDKQNDCLVFLPALLYRGFETQIQGLFSLSNST